jgi:hypothetical protein
MYGFMPITDAAEEVERRARAGEGLNELRASLDALCDLVARAGASAGPSASPRPPTPARS